MIRSPLGFDWKQLFGVKNKKEICQCSVNLSKSAGGPNVMKDSPVSSSYCNDKTFNESVR